MREIDDRYPEYAEANEPVKGGKHYRAIGFSPSLLLTAAAIMFVMAVVSPVLRPKPVLPDPTPIVIPVEDPEKEQEPEP